LLGIAEPRLAFLSRWPGIGWPFSVTERKNNRTALLFLMSSSVTRSQEQAQSNRAVAAPAQRRNTLEREASMSAASRRRRTLGTSQGFALISVLWVTSLLAVMAVSFASSSRTEALLARNVAENAKAEALADGAVHRAVLGLLDTDPETAWRPDRTTRAYSFGDGNVQVQIEDEDGKIDLNSAPLELLAGLFRTVGLDRDQAQAMADRVADFRDGDVDPEPQGAEEAAYRDAGLDHGPANRPFATESKLLHVLGMTQDLYQRVRPYVTVYSGSEGIDPLRAARPVLAALPGATPELVEALLSAEPGTNPLPAIQDSAQVSGLESYLIRSREVIYTIRALARAAGGTFLREAVVELSVGPDRPFLVHAWRRGLLPFEQS
jgi:general secretion pathway protein K